MQQSKAVTKVTGPRAEIVKQLATGKERGHHVFVSPALLCYIFKIQQ
jgi:hypothetical protein